MAEVPVAGAQAADELHYNMIRQNVKERTGDRDMETGRKVAVLTDTNSGITQEEGERLGIHVLPMPVMLDGQMYLEGVDICHSRLYEAIRQHKEISSSQPSPGQVMESWDRLLEEGYEEIVYIPMSSGLSGSCHNAISFAEEYQGKVQVVDNHRISVTQYGSALSALELAGQGLSAAQIREWLEERAYDASIYVSVDSMEYLKKGGRITPAAAALATVLNLKPVLTIQGGKLDTFAKARGMRQAETKMLEAIGRDRQERFGTVPDSGLQINVAGTFEDRERAGEWLELARKHFPDMEISYHPLPCSIACHVGMNAAGLGIMKKGS